MYIYIYIYFFIFGIWEEHKDLLVLDFILSITVFGFFTQKKNPPKLVPKNYLSLYTNFCTNSKTCINKSIQKKKNSLLIQQLVSIYIACNAKYIDLTVTSKIKQI